MKPFLVTVLAVVVGVIVASYVGKSLGITV
jgi:hypothetical protein